MLLVTTTEPRWTLLRQTVGLLGSNWPHNCWGANLTVAEQFDPAVIEPPQLSVTVKSPVAAVATLVAVAVPVFEIVNTAGELVVPTV